MSYPAYLSTFVGRKPELDEVKSLIRDKSTRLLTLTGPGGCGKTRLAYEALPHLADTFEDGVVWVDLVGLADPSAIPPAVAASLDVKTAPGQTPLEALTLFLQHREALVVLDNCEHLLAACAQLVDGLLRACPALHFLATSRQKLGIEGEQVWPVPPLSYPPDDRVSLDSLTRYDALSLFLARAEQVRPDLRVDEANVSELIRISRLLEGMPLAIELAASWVNVLDLAPMADRLEDQLALLEQRGRSTDVRHRSMRETIRWSHNLLSEEEKILFRRLGIFEGFSLEAVEAVCSGARLPRERILGLLGRLIDQSLVVRERARGGDSRYRQLASIHQFAREKLQEKDEGPRLRERHLAFFADLIREAEPHLLGPDQRRWTERLEADNDNLQAALSWIVQKAGRDVRALETAVRLVNALFWFWNYTERYEIGRGWQERVLNMPGLDRRTMAYADLTRGIATFIWLQGHYPAARTHLQASLKVAHALDYTYGIAHATLLSGVLARHQGHTEQAIDLVQKAEGLFQTLGSGRELAIARTNLGGLFMESGDLDAGRAYAEQAVSTARANDDLWGLGLALSGLGDVLFRQGEVDSAIPLMKEALEVLQQTGQSWLSAEALWRLAKMRGDQGDFEGAEGQLERCFALAQDSGALQWQIAALESLGFLSLKQGDSQGAAGHFLQALQMIPGQAFENVRLHLFAGIVQLAAHAQQWEEAATLWGAYQGLKAAQELPASQDEGATLALLQPHLESSQFSEGVQAGKTKTWTEAARLATEIVEGFKEQVIAIPSQFDLRLLALGPTKVYLKGRLLVPSDWTFAKPKELLFYLASSPPKTKEQIGLVFWPDASPSQLRAGLRAALYHLRRALGRREWVLYEDGFYRFNRDMDYWYDVEAFEAHTEQAEELAGDTPERAIERLETATQLYRGDFLLDIASDEWGTLRREELRRKYLTAMNALGDLYVDRGDLDRAVEVYHALLDANNLLEEAHRGLMQAYASRGERGLALRQYQTLVEIFRDELGVPPSPETTKLYEALQRDTR